MMFPTFAADNDVVIERVPEKPDPLCISSMNIEIINEH